MRPWIYVGTIVILLAAGIWRLQSARQPSPLSTDGSGGLLISATQDQVVQATHGHKLTLLNLWASWCGPCKEEFPTLLKLRQKYRSQGFELVFLSVDQPVDRPEAARFLASQSVDFPSFIAGESVPTLVAAVHPDWQGAVPTSFLFDASGKNIDSWQGIYTFEELDTKIAGLLK